MVHIDPVKNKIKPKKDFSVKVIILTYLYYQLLLEKIAGNLILRNSILMKDPQNVYLMIQHSLSSRPGRACTGPQRDGSPAARQGELRQEATEKMHLLRHCHGMSTLQQLYC